MLKKLLFLSLFLISTPILAQEVEIPENPLETCKIYAEKITGEEIEEFNKDYHTEFLRGLNDGLTAKEQNIKEAEKKYQKTKKTTNLVKNIGIGTSIGSGVLSLGFGIAGLANSGKYFKDYYLESTDVTCNREFFKKDPAKGCFKKCIYPKNGEAVSINEHKSFELPEFDEMPPM